MQELQEYANALVLAFETKTPIKGKAFKVWQWRIIWQYVRLAQQAKKSGIFGTVQVLNGYEIKEQKAEIKPFKVEK
ncbi:hypothetical protein P7L95_09950 [Bisgaard Taxon 10/6]|uniref:hypothetical protein n=1 Tax=Exercitatus varius TaxID=67857 RepID=UPI00294ADE2E|nr:hypothetical protein [Exercitatus varius]MDG2957064.1 hypothetical protein [Exercitatus varius]MDG2965248.1 hypothetical protein [Exercitatus varius]